MGKSIGGTLGLPVEGLLGPLALSFYDPIPTVAPPNDDLELQLVWLDIIERGGKKLTADHLGAAWLRHIHYMWDEYGRCRWNLRRGVPAMSAGTFENWFQSGMGSPIRSEIWACLFSHDHESAGYYAGLDASLDHGIEGIAGEVLFATMQALVASGTGIPVAIGKAVSLIPQSCETARAVTLIINDHLQGIEAWEGRRRLLETHDHENFTHAPLNVAIAVWALLHGEGDFEKSILLSTNAGYDTDSSTATVGATLGLALGLENLPPQWKDPIGDNIYIGPGIRGLTDAPLTLKDLTRRIIALLGKLESKKVADISWESSLFTATYLPGDIALSPLAGTESVAWANGELPTSVKRAGGAQWRWEVTSEEPREIICLARHGARLFINDVLVAECPEGLPYVPATHRSPDGSRVTVRPAVGTHTVRLELNSIESGQDASVILAYPNLHICPWTRTELPAVAELPAA